MMEPGLKRPLKLAPSPSHPKLSLMWALQHSSSLILPTLHHHFALALFGCLGGDTFSSSHTTPLQYSLFNAFVALLTPWLHWANPSSLLPRANISTLEQKSPFLGACSSPLVPWTAFFRVPMHLSLYHLTLAFCFYATCPHQSTMITHIHTNTQTGCIHSA